VEASSRICGKTIVWEPVQLVRCPLDRRVWHVTLLVLHV